MRDRSIAVARSAASVSMVVIWAYSAHRTSEFGESWLEALRQPTWATPNSAAGFLRLYAVVALLISVAVIGGHRTMFQRRTLLAGLGTGAAFALAALYLPLEQGALWPALIMEATVAAVVVAIVAAAWDVRRWIGVLLGPVAVCALAASSVSLAEALAN